MFRGFRDGRFAIGLALGFGLSILALLMLNPPLNRAENAGQTVSYSPVDSHAYDQKPYQKDNALVHWARRVVSLEDTSAQWLMTLFSAVAAVFLWMTLRKTNDTMRLMRNEQRPWLDFSIRNGSIKCRRREGQDPEVTVDTEIVAKNFGSSPAIDVMAISGIWTKGTLIVGRSAYADFIVTHLEKGWIASGVVFPNQEAIVADKWYRIPDRQVALPNSDGVARRVSLPTESWRLMVCLLYRSVNGDKHFTCKTYNVNAPPECFVKLTATLSLDGGLKPGEIGTEPYNQVYG